MEYRSLTPYISSVAATEDDPVAARLAHSGAVRRELSRHQRDSIGEEVVYEAVSAVGAEVSDRRGGRHQAPARRAVGARDFLEDVQRVE